MTPRKAKPVIAGRELLFFLNWINSLNCLNNQKIANLIKFIEEAIRRNGWLFISKIV
jgi:hypothetical protein